MPDTQVIVHGTFKVVCTDTDPRRQEGSTGIRGTERMKSASRRIIQEIVGFQSFELRFLILELVVLK